MLIWKMEERQYFQHIYAYDFMKGKRRKSWHISWRRYSESLIMSNVVYEIYYWRFLIAILGQTRWDCKPWNKKKLLRNYKC